MNTGILTDALRNLKTEEFQWKFALYSTQKSRDGLELEWNLCNMQGIKTQVDKIKEFLLKKPVAEKTVLEYSPFVSDKENIGAMEKEDEMIRDQIFDITASIRNGLVFAPDDFTTGAVSKPVGFAFMGEKAGAAEGETEQVLFMRRTNPFLSSAKSQLYVSTKGVLATSEEPIVKFNATADFVMIGNVCYFISSAVEKDFAFENRHFAIAAKRISYIAEASVVSDLDRLEAAGMSAKNAKKFIDFDKGILEHIVRLPIAEREEFLSTYGVTVDREGRMDTYDPEQCELIIDLLCCRSCLDPLGRLSVGSKITPRD